LLVWSCADMVLGSRSLWGYLGRTNIASAMALGSRIPQGYLTSKNSILVSAKVIWPTLVALKRRVVHNKALSIGRYFPLLSLLLEVTKVLCSHRARSQ
jgi:hypothetical protein